MPRKNVGIAAPAIDMTINHRSSSELRLIAAITPAGTPIRISISNA